MAQRTLRSGCFAQLKADLVDAARAGGELIDVSADGDKSRCVLVTPASAVTVETIDTAHSGDETDASDWSGDNWSIEEYIA